MKTSHLLIAAGAVLAFYVYGKKKGQSAADSATKTAAPIAPAWWTYAGNWAGGM